MEVSYVLPLRHRDTDGLAELATYLEGLARAVDVVVIDGSPPDVFAAHHRRLAAAVRHLPPDPDIRCRYGKVANVLTGLRRARHEAVVIADDDVRYTTGQLARVATLLDHADVVSPQNYFDPLPWHARWDTARTLLNRAFGADYPGTLGVRRSTLERTGGYDGDGLFENLELMRTVAVAGGVVAHVPDLFVRRLPPTAAHFRSQRVRQAYDSFAQPGRQLVELALLPAAVAAVAARRWRALAAGAGATVALAEVGRRRRRGRDVFPPSTSLMAPAWAAERAVCAWLAVGERVRFGGVRYGGTVFLRAAHSRRQLRRGAGLSLPPTPPARR